MGPNNFPDCSTCGEERFVCDVSESRTQVPAGCGQPYCRNNRRPCPVCTKGGQIVYVNGKPQVL